MSECTCDCHKSTVKGWLFTILIVPCGAAFIYFVVSGGLAGAGLIDYPLNGSGMEKIISATAWAFEASLMWIGEHLPW